MAVFIGPSGTLLGSLAVKGVNIDIDIRIIIENMYPFLVGNAFVLKFYLQMPPRPEKSAIDVIGRIRVSFASSRSKN